MMHFADAGLAPFSLEVPKQSLYCFLEKKSHYLNCISLHWICFSHSVLWFLGWEVLHCSVHYLLL